MKTTHTPSRWIVNGSERTTSIWVEDTVTDKRVCTVTPGDDDADRARLIAAAPELLAALEGLMTHFVGDRNATNLYGEGGIAADIARAALAKARGQA